MRTGRLKYGCAENAGIARHLFVHWQNVRFGCWIYIRHPRIFSAAGVGRAPEQVNKLLNELQPALADRALQQMGEEADLIV